MVHERSADIGNRTVRYLEAGAGWPVVLLHAFPLSADMWRPQLEHVPNGWRMLTPDLRGFGPAAKDGARTLGDMAEDVIALLDALRIEQAAIGGLSMGGYVALTLFRIAPERFSAVILANTRAAAETPEGKAGRDKMSALVRAGGPAAVADQMVPKLLGKTSLHSRPHLPRLLRGLIEANTPEGIDGALQAMKERPDATPLLPTVGRPALVVTGDEYVLIPTSEAEAMHGLLPRAQLVTLPRAGHLSNMESPDDFSEALGNFLRANL